MSIQSHIAFIFWGDNYVVIIVSMFREIIGIEYLNEVREMNHWAFGPHHMWTDIVTGDIIR